jgi:uncharacterized glyoxalase superfamily protein PhnB
MRVHFMLYVSDQANNAKFYSAVLGLTPTLDVPGMTEFTLNDGCVLGLMPEKGIKRLLGNKIPDVTKANGIPRAELYLRVEDPSAFQKRAVSQGAAEVSQVKMRDWGDLVGYTMDLDGHVLAFAKDSNHE